MCTQKKKQISEDGTCRGNYKPKAQNIKKLQIFLNTIKNES